MSDDRKREALNDEDGTHRTKVNRETSTETGSGAEATRGMQGKPESDSQTPRSSYGGDGGEPKEPRDFPHSRR